MSSFKPLQHLLDAEEKEIVYNILQSAIKQALKIIENKYSTKEVSNQIFYLLSENSGLESHYNNREVLTNTSLNDFNEINDSQNRYLQQQQASNSTTVIFQSVLIIFVLLSLWIWIEMLNMKVYRDTIVYSKFLAEEYIRQH